MSMRNALLALAAGATLAACGSGPVRRISPPTASVQELVVQPDGAWRISLRIQNFSTVSTTFSRLRATLTVAGTEVGDIVRDLDLEIPAESADVVVAMLSAGAKLPAGDFAYDLEGTIDTSDPKGSYPLHRESRLSPIPGLINTYR